MRQLRRTHRPLPLSRGRERGRGEGWGTTMTVATEPATRETALTTERHVGVIGLAVMGENLALNIERNGFPIAVYNRTPARTEEFLATRAQGVDVQAAIT